MTEEQHRKWDIIIKGIITPLIAVVTILFGIYQYTDSQTKSLEREYELKRIERTEKAFEEKSVLYRETRQLLAFLATNKDIDSHMFGSNKIRFWELYFGDLAAVESKEIEGLMVKFGSLLSKLEKSKRNKGEVIQNELEQISLSFANQTYKELNE